MFLDGQNGIGVSLNGLVSLRSGNASSLLPWQLPGVTEYWDGLIGITQAGGFVSAWAPVVGTHTLTQGTGAAQPAYSGGVLTFDGVNDTLTNASFVYTQPFTILMAVAQDNFTNGNLLCAMEVSNAVQISQRTSSGIVQQYAGSALSNSLNTGVLSAYHVISYGFNGASSWGRDGSSARVTGGNPGATNASVISLMATTGGTNGVNGRIRAVAICNTALSTTDELALIQSMGSRYGISV